MTVRLLTVLALLALPPLRAACDKPPADQPRSAIAEGAPAPAVALPDQKGATWTLSQHLPAAVVFYRGHW
jgi:hypothetical protein